MEPAFKNDNDDDDTDDVDFLELVWHFLVMFCKEVYYMSLQSKKLIITETSILTGAMKKQRFFLCCLYLWL